jgi:hypothetical protein
MGKNLPIDFSQHIIQSSIKLMDIMTTNHQTVEPRARTGTQKLNLGRKAGKARGWALTRVRLIPSTVIGNKLTK